jgi:hypothetical protein
VSWEAIGALANLIGAAAVVVSLLYLGRQVRSGTRELRSNTRDSAFHSLMEWNYYVMSDPELGWIFQSGCRDFRSLPEKERARLVHVMYSFFKMFENIYLHHLDGSVEESVWTHNKPMLLAYAALPGARYYLENRRKIFDPRFWQFLAESRPDDVPAGHLVSELADQPRATAGPPDA